MHQLIEGSRHEQNHNAAVVVGSHRKDEAGKYPFEVVILHMGSCESILDGLAPKWRNRVAQLSSAFVVNNISIYRCGGSHLRPTCAKSLC